MNMETYTLADISAKATRLLNEKGKQLSPAESRKRLIEIYETAHLLVLVWEKYSAKPFYGKQRAIVKNSLSEFPAYLSALHALAEETLAELSN